MATRLARAVSPRTPAPIAVPPPRSPDEDRAERERRLAELHERLRACTQCVAAGYLARSESVAGYRGKIGDRVLLVGQAPGHLSVERGLPFSGPGGRVLDAWLQRAGFPPGALRTRVYISALTRCDPGKSPRGCGDRKPSPPELALCRPYLLTELELLRPAVILAVGGMAIEAFLGPQRLDDVIGQSFEQSGARILPLPHPSGVSRWLNESAHQALLASALELLALWRHELRL
jgi:uracil-DNA glycosylase family 4